MPSGKYGIGVPRASSSGSSGVSAVPAQDQRARRWRRRPGYDEAVLGALHLTRRLAAELAHALVHEAQPVDVRLGEVPARGVDRERARRPLERAALHERSALAARAEPEVLDGHQHLAREVLVQLRDVDVRRADTSPGVEVGSDARESGRGPERSGPAEAVATIPA